MRRRARAAIGAALALGAAGSGCGGGTGAGALHEQAVILEREVEGLRASAAKLERGESILPEEAVVVSIAEQVVQQFVNAQLPFAVEVDRYRIVLSHARAAFKGSPSLTLTGTIVHEEHPDYVGEVRAIGALEGIEVDSRSGTLHAQVAVDHVELLRAGGLEKLLSGGTVDELARTVRKRIEGRIPPVQIPVQIEQAIELPSVRSGPVRIQGATMPLAVSVADVLAGQGVLWIAINVVPGELVKSEEGP